MKPFFLIRSFCTNFFVIILRDIIVLGNFLLSFSQSESRITMCNLHWCYTFCTGVTLFALVLHLNCTALSQSESSNFFMYIIIRLMACVLVFAYMKSLKCVKLSDLPMNCMISTDLTDSLRFSDFLFYYFGGFFFLSEGGNRPNKSDKKEITVSMARHTLSMNSKIDPRYLCSLCSNILKDPVQTGCGHVYCNSCIQDLKR